MVATLSDNRRSFPDCDQALLLDGTTFIGEVASIEALSAHDPRYNNQTDSSSLSGAENFLLLCPNHHRMIDPGPHTLNSSA